MKYLNSIILNLNLFFENRISLNKLFSYSLLSLLLSICMGIALNIMGHDYTNIIIRAIGLVGLVNWIFLIIWGRAKRYQFDRSLAHSNMKRLGYILFLVITIPCSIYLLCMIIPSFVWKYNALDGFNRSFINPFLNHGDFDEVFAKSLISLLGTFFLSGVLVSMLVSLINQEAERWKQGELSYKFQISGYRVVIGGHETSSSLIKQLIEKYENDKVIVYSNREIPSFRREIEACLDAENKKERVIFYYGSLVSR